MNFINTKIEPNTNQTNFEAKALSLFYKQAAENKVYNTYLKYLKINASQITCLNNIPFLPISFFKTHTVKTGNYKAETHFLSSGTTQQNRSKHYIKQLAHYQKNFTEAFTHFYGNLNNIELYTILPSYHKNKHSSLIYMVDKLIENSHKNSQHFYTVSEFMNSKTAFAPSQNTKLLLGVTYALLDLAEQHAPKLNNWIIMETGGMKGQRKEMIRADVHKQLKQAFKVSEIHSEYGMSEMLSQAYSNGNGIFNCPPTVKILTHAINEPFGPTIYGKTGVIKVIDLANQHSCAFIETEDLGRVYHNGSFEILGRIDNSQLRGCNLMYEGL